GQPISPALPFNATAAQLQSALEKLSTVGTGNVVVTKSGSVFSITFAGPLATAVQPPFTASGSANPVVSPGRGLTKLGPGTLDYVGPTPDDLTNTYTGRTQDNEGTLHVNKGTLSEIQQITALGNTGEFQVTFNGFSTPAPGQPGALQFNATQADVLAALEALTSIGTG